MPLEDMEKNVPFVGIPQGRRLFLEMWRSLRLCYRPGFDFILGIISWILNTASY
jgi:hypothetical protein